MSLWQVPFHLVLLSPTVPLPVFLLSGLLFACRRRIFIGLSFFSSLFSLPDSPVLSFAQLLLFAVSAASAAFAAFFALLLLK